VISRPRTYNVNKLTIEWCDMQCRYIIRPPDVCTSKGFQNAIMMFFYLSPNFLDRAASGHWPPTFCWPPIKSMYQRFGRKPISLLPLSIFAHPSIISQGSKVAKFGLDFRHHSPLSRPHFEAKKLVDTKV